MDRKLDPVLAEQYSIPAWHLWTRMVTSPPQEEENMM